MSSNDVVDLTDRFNDIVDTYQGMGDAIVDLDAWATEDLLEVVSIVEQAIHLRALGEDIEGRDYGD